MPREPADAVPRKHVLVVDDDALFRESLSRNLVDAGFEVIDFGDGESALSHVREGGPADLVLLDWKMPKMNGIEVLRRMRDDGVSVPVIFLTVLSDQIFEEAALQGGAVDFVEKSRSFSILLKRIGLTLSGPKGAAAAPGAPEGEADTVRTGELELHPHIGRAYWKGAQVELSLTEFKIVHLLSARAGLDVRYRDIYDIVHGQGFAAGYGPDGYRTNVRTFIKRIRQKFREIDKDFDEIENYPGFGYRWREPEQGAR